MRNSFYRCPRLLILTILLILAWGFSSFNILPLVEDPALSQWYGRVTTRFPGASAVRVESLVTEKLEQELQDIVKNHDEVWSQVRERLGDVSSQLPPETTAPNFEALNDRGS